MTTSFQMEGGESRPMAEATMLVSQSLGQRVTIQLDNPLTGQSVLQEIYISLPGRTITALMPDQKQFSKVELDDASIERWRRESDPKRIVEQVLQCEHTPLGRSVIDGIEVEGFRTTDPSCLGETSMTGAEVTIWADAKTRLPVRMEIVKGEQGKGQMCVATHDFQWDITADATEFEPIIPPDYTLGRPMMQLGPRQ